VDKMGLRGPHDFQQRLFYPVLRTMVRGVRIDKARQTAMRARLNAHAKNCIEAIEKMVGWPLNPKSPKQMQRFFYEELGLPVQKKRGAVGPSCDDAALDTFRAKVPYLRPLVDAIKEFRSCETVAANALKAGAIGHDGRVHCSYNITGATTFRFSSSTDAFGSGYNLQNITAGDEK
jgi:DNA polymerase I-like protein with 3'-5' exonuclease and polymerase domains